MEEKWTRDVVIIVGGLNGIGTGVKDGNVRWIGEVFVISGKRRMFMWFGDCI